LNIYFLQKKKSRENKIGVVEQNVETGFGVRIFAAGFQSLTPKAISTSKLPEPGL